MDITYIYDEEKLNRISCTFKNKVTHIPVGGYTKEEAEDLQGLLSAVSVALSRLEKEYDESRS